MYDEQHRPSTYSSNEEIDITEVLREMPESKNMDSPNPANSSDNMVIMVIKVIFALIFSQLQKLPISARIIHQFLILHFILTSIGVSQYLMLYPTNIIDKYQYWRFFTFMFADTNVFMALFGCITLSALISRMEYFFGSTWTLYLFVINYFLICAFTFLTQYIFLAYFPFLPVLFTRNSSICVGLYPMIFSLSLIEIYLSFPLQINHIFGIVYIAHIYHPIIYCIVYNVLLRFDISTFVIIACNIALLYCTPSLFHLSRHTIQKMQSSKCLQCLFNDKLFLSIENIDYDAFVSRGKYISAKSDKNTDIHLNVANNENLADQSYHSTLLMQRNLINKAEDTEYNINILNMYDASDSEHLPFIVSHPSQGASSNLSNISSHQSNNMPVNRKRG